MPIRVLVDRTIVETFVGGGRGVVATPVLAPGGNRTGIYFAAGSTDNSKDAALTGLGGVAAAATGVTVADVVVWSMGCGWASFP